MQAPLKEPTRAVPAKVEGSESLRDISKEQWNSGIAAWLGWMFDGLDMHLYTLVAAPFVAELLGGLATKDPAVGKYAAIIQGAFLVGWALGGGCFGVIADRIGRSRALSLTILTYALFTGLSFLATRWWHLMIFRFVAALGIGGEWAVGASLLSETWPRRWRPWIAAVLQSGVNIGILAACLASYLMANLPNRYLFLVGVVPALMVLWIRRAVPEPEEWHAARAKAQGPPPRIAQLFQGDALRVTVWVMVACGLSLTAHWAFMFWYAQHLRELPEVVEMTAEARTQLVSTAMFLITGSNIVGCFLSGGLARLLGYRAAIAWSFFFYFLAMLGAYSVPRDHWQLLAWFVVIGVCQGAFALFTMYLPPLFPTLLRTTGAGFCYNVGRIVAAFGTVFFGLYARVGASSDDPCAAYRVALLCVGALFLPAAFVSLMMPHAKD